MEEFIQVISRLINGWQSEERPVYRDIKAKDLATILNLQLCNHGSDLEELENALKEFIYYSPDVSQVGFHKQLYSGANMPALLGEFVAGLSNSVMHTYKVGPVATLMELELIVKLNKLIGFKNGEGIMVSGASQANLIAMMLARHKSFPKIKKEGYSGRTMSAYVSDQAHYSMQRAANITGIGENNLIAVKSDAIGRMNPLELSRCIEHDQREGKIPFFIGLTAGTTVVGAFDPIIECSKIARDNNIWLHVDGAWGGPALFSEQHKMLLNGAEKADSLTWDAHKFMNVPLTAGFILVKKSGQLRNCVTGGGNNYLFHKENDSEPNLGEMSIQSARRADCLKVWSSWKYMGSDGFATKMDKLQREKEVFVKLIDARMNFEIIAPNPFLNVLYRYHPDSVTDERKLRILNVEICNRMAASGGGFIDYASFKCRTGIRLIFANESITHSYMIDLLNKCEEIGRTILEEQNKYIQEKNKPLSDRYKRLKSIQ